MNIEAARLLAWRAAWLLDQGTPNTKFASFAKAFAADTAMKVYEGTSEIQRNIIVRELIKGR